MTINWLPKNYEEFREAALAGRVSLDYSKPQYEGLEKVLKQGLFESTAFYDKRIIAKMISNPEYYDDLVHKCGVDLVLSD